MFLMLMTTILLSLIALGFGVWMILTLTNIFGKFVGYFIAIAAFLIMLCSAYTGFMMKGQCMMMHKDMSPNHMMENMPMDHMDDHGKMMKN